MLTHIVYNDGSIPIASDWFMSGHNTKEKRKSLLVEMCVEESGKGGKHVVKTDPFLGS